MTQLAYLNPALSPEERTEDLLSRMTLEEKAGLMFQPAINIPGRIVSAETALADAEKKITAKNISHIHVMDGDDTAEIAQWLNRLQEIAANTRLGIPISFSTDPRSGFHSSPFTGKTADAVSRWPEHTGLAATRDIELVRQYADVIRREMLAMGIRVYLGPMADIFSEPRWSRGFGTFGEDPQVASDMVAAFIKGLRGGPELTAESVTAIVKHFPGGGPQLRGMDAHDKRFREQVYPGHQQELHLRPFEAAFAAGVTQVMPYYGMPIGTDWQERGFAFNAPVIKGLLREKYGFDGIVCTDWYLLEPAVVEDLTFGPNGYGLEELTPTERLKVAVDVGVDQFGGDDCPERVVDLVSSGHLSEQRLDTSARRLLLEKFRLGLFEHRYVDIEKARVVGADPENHRLGEHAQAAALTLLKNENALPLAPATRFYTENIDWDDVHAPLTHVMHPEHADVNVIRLSAPYEPDPDGALGDFFHHGRLDFTADVVNHLRELSDLAPTIVVVYLERPAVLADLEPHAVALVGEYGASDRVILEALLGHTPFTGTLPFDLPRSMDAIKASREDVPFDTAEPLYAFGHGLALTTRE
ncbi:glycoside hydrolase family 3 N-terminal domain-containing protein [Microbacterium sp. 2MCAF23]|uniref:glycoside hydrolase family 3 protein n=1 Tax=Microbacterium sp. 2MCAF23 TaxID=3232985 RepID=UPI003F9DCDA7